MEQARPIEYKGKVIDFPLENPSEKGIPDEELHEHLARPSTERTKRLKARCRWKHASAGEFAVASPLINWSRDSWGYQTTTAIIGSLTLIIGLGAALSIRLPSGDQAPMLGGTGVVPRESIRPGQAVRSLNFWLLWCTFALTGAAGMAMITVSIGFGLSQGLAVGQAVIILTSFNLTNGLSRIVSGVLSDLIGRNLTMSLAFFLAGLAYMAMVRINGLVFWSLMAATVGFAFGTLFAVSAPLISDCFGLLHFGAVFGAIFTAHGFLAGPLGPWLGGFILDHTKGAYSLVFGYLGLFLLTSAVLVWFVKPPSSGGRSETLG